MLVTIAIFVLALTLLIIGAELFVRGAAGLAASLRIAPVIIGLTVVAFGTSAPELAVSVQSVLSGQNDLAIGNVIGSNILNVLLILGLSAVVSSLTVAPQLIKFDVPLLVLVSVVVLGLGWDGRLDFNDGLILVAGLVIYNLAQLWQHHATRHRPALEEQVQATEAAAGGAPRAGSAALLRRLALVGIGLVLLVAGADRLVSSATTIARSMGVSELVIGLTIVALGTSLPEVATSVVAAIRGQREIAVGNVVGSNLFNLLCVLGIASLVARGGLVVDTQALHVDLPIMIGVELMCLPVFFSGCRIHRWEGVLFLVLYVAYTADLFLSANGSTWLSTCRTWMIYGMIPLTAAILAVTSIQELRARRERARQARSSAAAASGPNAAG